MPSEADALDLTDAGHALLGVIDEIKAHASPFVSAWEFDHPQAGWMTDAAEEWRLLMEKAEALRQALA